MLARFGATQDANYAQRTAKVYLLLPEAGADFTRIESLADQALSAGASHWREYTKGLVEYRQGRFASAVKWAEQALGQPKSAPAYEALCAQACMVLAMAHYQLNQADEAPANGVAAGRQIQRRADAGHGVHRTAGLIAQLASPTHQRVAAQ